jgi:hypothetical protein
MKKLMLSEAPFTTRIRRTMPGSPWWRGSLINIGNVKLAKGDRQSAISDYEKSRAIRTRLDQEDVWKENISENFQKLRQKGISDPYMDRVTNEVMGCKQPILNQGRRSTPGRPRR